MIIWERYGILGIIIPFGLAVLSQVLFGDPPLFAGIGYLMSAFPVWYIGRKWNSNNQGDKKKHTLFWIHLEYWGILAGILGLTIILSETIIEVSTDVYFIVLGLGIIPILIYQYSRSQSTVKDMLHKLLPIRIIEPNETSLHKNISRGKLTANEVSVMKAQEGREDSNNGRNISESQKAIREFKKSIAKPKNFEPSDHSRFMPPTSSTNIINSPNQQDDLI